MRTVKDRIRHALSFEAIGLLLVIPLGAWVFPFELGDMGIVAIVSATLATVWTYVFNLLFDHAMLRLAGHLRKTVLMRVFHSILFEMGLLLILLPFIAWYLQVSLFQAFVMDLSFAVFYVIYAFVFNWLYDLVFPLPGGGSARIARDPSGCRQAALGPQDDQH